MFNGLNSLSKSVFIWVLLCRWLGKNSSQRKKYRELKELRSTMSHAISGNRKAVLFDYLRPMVDLIHYNMKEEENVIEISN